MMKRSQIYIPMEQWRFLSVLGRQTHESVSTLIRRALDKVYKRPEQIDFQKALDGITGLWKDREDIHATEIYIRNLRSGSRLKRLYKQRRG